MTYEELNTWFIDYVGSRRNKIVNQGGIHSSREKELQKTLVSYAEFTGQDIEELNESTNKNNFYKQGQLI